MLSTVGQTDNNIQRFTAANAFRTNSTVTRPQAKEENTIADTTSSGTKSAPKKLLDRVDVADIRRCAEYAGEYNITDDDIKYGLMYGRSVIAEWVC